jgi:hypothetical protein
MTLTLNLLHRECCLAVPCAFVGSDAASGAALTPVQLRRLLGYREHEEEDKPGELPRLVEWHCLIWAWLCRVLYG